MADLNGEQFRMTTNMKASVNSQGTLFQGGKPIDSARYPRGYTPARMAEVKGALERTETSTTPKNLVTSEQAREMGQAHKIGPNAETQGVWVGGDKVEKTKYVVKDPAEQMAATRAGNKTTCSTCKGTGTIPHMSHTYEDLDGRSVTSTQQAEHCWDCGGMGMADSTSPSAHPGTGKVKLSDVADAGDADQYQAGKRTYPAEAGKTGIHDTTEIIGRNRSHPFLRRQGMRDIYEAIARSTMPVKHLDQRIGRIRVASTPGMRDVAGHAQYGEIGLETVPAAHHTEDYGHSKREQAASTLIHELGHTAGAMSGLHHQDEAKADAYMLQHYRPDPRNQRKRPSVLKGAQWLYSSKAGDDYDPDKVTAPGETPVMRDRRLQRNPAKNFRSGGSGPAKRSQPEPVQGELF